MHNQTVKKLLALILALTLLLTAVPVLAKGNAISLSASDYPVRKDGSYSTMEEVAVYLATYGKLPSNFIRKNQAENLGWDNRAGNLDEVAPGCSIGGDRFGNYEGVLPDAKGRKWTECDINFAGRYRGAERICFSSDGLIYYTNDHYQTFRQVKVSFEEKHEEAPVLEVNLTADVEKYGEYTSLDEVASYLLQFGELPCNYLTRDDAKELGWTAKKNNLGELMPGCSIGGDIYQNREKSLPAAKGRVWRECDLNAVDGKRSNERLIYSDDGLMYYTPDAYKTFIQIH